MLKARLNPKWTAETFDMLRDVAAGVRTKPVEHTTAELAGIRWLICTADELQLPYKIIQLGAGVRKFTTDVTVCPKCHGTGKC